MRSATLRSRVPNQSPETLLLDTKQTASLLGLKVNRIRKAVFRKEIPFVKIGRLVRFQRQQLDQWLNDLDNKGRPVIKNSRKSLFDSSNLNSRSPKRRAND